MDISGRRHFLHSAAPALLLVGASPAPARKPAPPKKTETEEDVTPTEDLMREEQHKAGRRVTERILALTTAGLKNANDKRELASLLESFVRMYAPHEAREDTVLFPALRRLVSAHEYDALGEAFEDEEHRKFGQEGFEGMVEKVAGLEKTLGIYDLKQFTPR
jgi:hemerythrin-like domain-containing protein